MRFLIIGAILGLSACGACGEGGPKQMPGPVQTSSTVRAECVDYCFHRMQCYKEICRTDYPGSASEFHVSELAQDCVTRYCETSGYLTWKQQDQSYLDCTANKTCREITTGVCGDTAQCTSDPDSTPYLTGTTTKAKPLSVH